MINESKAKLYCCEPIEFIENYAEAVVDTTQTWDCHHRLQVQGQFTNSAKLLKRCGMYFNRPACELIFLTHSQHIALHNKAGQRSKKAMAKMTFQQRSKGGKKAVKKMLAKLTHEQLVKGGKMPWWNNGVINAKSYECPGEGWVRGMLKRRAK